MFVDFAGPFIPLLNGQRFISNRWDTVTATIGQDETLALSSLQLVGQRTLVRFPEQYSFDLTDDPNREFLQGRDSWVQLDERGNRNAWAGVPGRVRASCGSPAEYLVVSTGTTEDHNLNVRTESTEAPCDPCWIGTWRVDNDSFRSVVLGAIESSGELPAGVSIDFLLEGDYFFQVDGGGTWAARRNGYTITVTTPAGDLVTTVSSIDAGTWTATPTTEDGSRSEGTFGIPTNEVVDVRSSTDVPGVGSAAIDSGGATATLFGQTGSVGAPGFESSEGAGRYSCDDDGDLEVFLDGFASQIVFQRVAEPLTAPSSLEPEDG